MYNSATASGDRSAATCHCHKKFRFPCTKTCPNSQIKALCFPASQSAINNQPDPLELNFQKLLRFAASAGCEPDFVKKCLDLPLVPLFLITTILRLLSLEKLFTMTLPLWQDNLIQFTSPPPLPPVNERTPRTVDLAPNNAWSTEQANGWTGMIVLHLIPSFGLDPVFSTTSYFPLPQYSSHMWSIFLQKEATSIYLWNYANLDLFLT